MDGQAVYDVVDAIYAMEKSGAFDFSGRFKTAHVASISADLVADKAFYTSPVGFPVLQARALVKGAAAIFPLDR